ncbi:MAG: DUF503 domain-containing protein [Acidimicrobiia bacterium]|nr:DUF503 domain-containing protein [Acidimicrobiia bacterium]MCY4435275.1 DUF503 domain-containing protein [bacterium]
MHVLAVVYDLHIPGCQSLKERRSVLRPLLSDLARRFGVSAAETGHTDLWQRAEVGMAVVSGQPGQCRSLADDVDRFIWSIPEIEVVGSSSHWLNTEE